MNAQIIADQAIRAEGEQHTANTVEASIRYTTFAVRREFAKLSAAEQRSLWNAAPFGRREVRHAPERGGFQVRTTVGYGSDYNVQDWTYAEVARLLNRGATVVGWKD